jgi:hypothetical protein
MTQRDVRPTGDRELEQYLEGGSKLSRRYRDASGEGAPPDLDEVILAQARAELRRKPSLNRWLASAGLAASLVLGVNLAWNVYQAKPEFAPESPPLVVRLEKAPATVDPEPQRERKARALPPAPQLERESELESIEVTGSRLPEDAEQAKAEAREEVDALRMAESQRRAKSSQDTAAAAPSAPPAPVADAAPLSEAARIDHLILYVHTLEGAVFMRKGKEYTPAAAAKHLQYKRESSGDGMKTADDFIRLCVAHSSLWGEGYTIRFADGRTRTAEDVLREELTRIQTR